ncbi:hypothetical protein HY380_01790 [Candidatus Saccharibacteria bacterium]|nr:hypothetical protein [Candidatus Saccharibacteria bacterium]
MAVAITAFGEVDSAIAAEFGLRALVVPGFAQQGHPSKPLPGYLSYQHHRRISGNGDRASRCQPRSMIRRMAIKEEIEEIETKQARAARRRARREARALREQVQAISLDSVSLDPVDADPVGLEDCACEIENHARCECHLLLNPTVFAERVEQLAEGGELTHQEAFQIVIIEREVLSSLVAV